MTFHAEHKYLVLSHNQDASRTLGRLVAEAEKPTLKETLAEYEDIMMNARDRASVKTQVNTFSTYKVSLSRICLPATKLNFLQW